MLDFIQRNQSEAQDEKLNNIRLELKVKEICLPDILIKIMNLLRDLIHDFEMIQNALKRK